jgi:hypothetical protein
MRQSFCDNQESSNLPNGKNQKTMKGTFCLLMLLFITAATAQQAPLSAPLSDQINEYKANGLVRTDSLEVGTLKVTRTYSKGTSSLTIRITKIAADQKVELPKQVQRLTEEFLKMAAAGKLQAEAKNTTDVSGILTYYEGTAGAILIFKGLYLIEYQLTEVSSVVASQKILEALNLSAL